MPCLQTILPKTGSDVNLKCIYLYSNLGSPYCIFVLFVVVCCHTFFHCYHTLQLKYMQCQMYLVAPWISHPFFSGTCCLLELLKIVVTCICICQTGMRMLSNMITYLNWGYNIWSLYLWHKYFAFVSFGSISFIVGPLWTGHSNATFNLAGLRHSIIFPFSFGTSMNELHHSAISSMSKVWLHLPVVATLVLSWMVFVEILHISWWQPDMACCWFNLQWNKPSKQDVSVNTSLNSVCGQLCLCTHPPVSLLTWTWKKVIYFSIFVIYHNWISIISYNILSVGLAQWFVYASCFSPNCLSGLYSSFHLMCVYYATIYCWDI